MHAYDVYMYYILFLSLFGCLRIKLYLYCIHMLHAFWLSLPSFLLAIFSYFTCLTKCLLSTPATIFTLPLLLLLTTLGNYLLTLDNPTHSLILLEGPEEVGGWIECGWARCSSSTIPIPDQFASSFVCYHEEKKSLFRKPILRPNWRI